jgi:F-type H+-transporting ATPase subunit delta
MKTVKQTMREAKRLFRLCFVNGLLDESRVRLAAQKIIESGRRGRQEFVYRFLSLVRLDRARHTAEIQSSTPLTEDVRASIQTDLTHIYGPGISTSFIENPSLIGGMRIKIGSDVYDGSVKAGLDALEKSF